MKNKLDIRDPALLRKVEADLSTARQAEIFHTPVVGRFTATHLCNIHRKLLGDVYSFAGHFRREDIAKGPTRFVTYSQIKEKLQRLLGQLQQEKWLENVPFEAFAARSAYYMAELNYIHPFREGNGRFVHVHSLLCKAKPLRDFLRLGAVSCCCMIFRVPACWFRWIAEKSAATHPGWCRSGWPSRCSSHSDRPPLLIV